MNSKSDMGARAAWKGFSSQTIYIAYRLMILNEKYDLYPESVEDLMIKEKDIIRELIQVKNFSANLTLSKFNPEKEDSFFRRVLKHKTDEIKLKIISFGEVGPELDGLNKKNQQDVISFKKKMVSFGYSDDDISWIIEHLEIIKEDEEELKQKIFEKLSEDFVTSISAQIIFDSLVNYISNLSRNVQMTNWKIWSRMVKRIIDDIVSIKGMHAQYGRTILNLSEYKTDKNITELEKEYMNGVNAKPDHIRNNLDIYRKKWMEKIDEAFLDNNIVIIKGISGQGKSTLAYRYLMDNFNEEFIFVIEHVNNYNQAEDIVAAINGLSRSRAKETIIYIDINPYDKSWMFILEQIKKRNLNLKVLITIREEDYKRLNINTSVYELKEIEIELDKEEAQEIYNKLGSKYFISFEDAWKNFGCHGPFMEFMYLLSEKQTLTEKLTCQIDNIIENESDSDNWLKLLLLVSYAGKENLRVNIEQIKEILNINNFSKMLKNLKKEYLINVDEELEYVISTHALRAKLLVEIILKKLPVNRINLIINLLGCINDYCPTLIVEYMYDNMENIDEFVNKIISIKYKSWSIYAAIVRSMLWLDAYKMYEEKKEKFKILNQISNNTFATIFLGDITGYIEFDVEKQFEILKNVNSEAVEKIKEKYNPSEFKIKYKYTDLVLGGIKEEIQNKKIKKNDDYSMIGYILFWLAQRNIYIKSIALEEIEVSKTEQVLDLLIGFQVQGLKKDYSELEKKIKDLIIRKYNIVYFSNENDMIIAKFLNTFDGAEKSYNDKLMDVVYCLRRLYYNKITYNVKMIGADLLEWAKIPDTEKCINQSNLPLSWITSINKGIIDIDVYNMRTDSWEDYKVRVDEINNLVNEFVSKYCIALDYFYKKYNTIKLIDKDIETIEQDIICKNQNMYMSPKCTTDKYGVDNILISIGNNSGYIEKNNVSNMEQNEKKEYGIINKFEKYIRSFINFLRQKNIAFVSKVKCEENNNINLSHFNIYESLSSFTDFYKEYINLFKDPDFLEQLYDKLKTLELFWENFVNKQFYIQKDMLYDINLTKRKKESQFEEYIQDTLNSYINQIDDKEYYCIDIFKSDEFYEHLYKPYSNINRISYDSFLLEEYQKVHQDTLEIVYTLGGKNMLLGTSLDLKKVLYSKNHEDFQQKQIVKKYEIGDFQESVNQKDTIYNAILAIGKFNNFKMYYRYIVSVNRELEKCSEVITKEVYDDWCENTKKMFQAEIDEFRGMCRIVFDEVTKDKEHIIETENYIEKFDDFASTLDKIVKEKSIDNMTDLDELQNLLVDIINVLQYGNEQNDID